MASTQFVVDLGSVKLTDAQKNSINAAIQKAVAGELAAAGSTSRLAFFPVGDGGIKYPFPFIWGFIVRPVKDQWIKDIKEEIH